VIYTVTLNPSLDKTLSVPDLRPGEVHRARVIRQDCGGKGVNVSRALRLLGIESEIVALFAGATGRRLQAGLDTTHFRGHYLWLDGETRQNITLFDESRHQYTKLNEPGPVLDPEHLAQLDQLIRQLASPGDLWAFCGSLPPGAPAALYARLIALIQQRGGRAFLDSSGPALRAGLAAGPFAIKPNSEEAGELLGRTLTDDADHARAALAFQAGGTSIVALSRGSDGLVLGMEDKLLVAKPPPVAALSPIGAGDASLAGLLWSLAEECTPQETASRIVACGTAAAMQEGTALGSLNQIQALLPQIDIHPITVAQESHLEH
jgi:1-phosphofructokinase family hexose kinase